MSLKSQAGNTDIYLLDQILKGRYRTGERILDAGCGSGRNLHWFILNNFDIYGVDQNETLIHDLKGLYPVYSTSFSVAKVESIPYPDEFFDHIICNAVLHFAEGHKHFNTMMHELVSCLKTGGTLFIRMTSDIGIENQVEELENGVYFIPDGSTRYLLTRETLKEIMDVLNLEFAEPLKTVNVNDQRCMSTLILKKS